MNPESSAPFRFRYAFAALGSVFTISVRSVGNPALDGAVRDARSLIADFEAEFSRFRPDSPLSTLNRIGKLRVSERFFRLSETAARAFEISEGYFNPFFDVSGIGYVRPFEAESEFRPSESGISEPPAFSEFRIEGSEAMLPVGAKLDFGAIGKGFLADEIASFLKSRGFADFVLDFGGDVVASTDGGRENSHSIAIASPFVAWEAIGTVRISNAAISTSGSSVRRWKTPDGRELHHIISPYGASSEWLASVTVFERTWALSDALATGFFAAGPQAGPEIARRKSVDALFVLSDGRVISTVRNPEKYGLSMR